MNSEDLLSEETDQSKFTTFNSFTDYIKNAKNILNTLGYLMINIRSIKKTRTCSLVI